MADSTPSMPAPEEPSGPSSEAAPESPEGRSPEEPGPAGRRGAFGAGFLALFIPTVAATALGVVHLGWGFVRQPVDFNHRKHVEELGLACDACHAFYAKETFPGLPTAEDCGGCHGEAQGEGAKERALVERLKRGEGLEWKGLFTQPPHVFFSHRRHVAAAEIGCPVCHGAMGQSASPPTRVHKLSMKECIACHRDSQIPVGCTTCHR